MKNITKLITDRESRTKICFLLDNLKESFKNWWRPTSLSCSNLMQAMKGIATNSSRGLEYIFPIVKIVCNQI